MYNIEKIRKLDFLTGNDNYHIYLQIPFCRYKCPYCCFISAYKVKELTALENVSSYVDALTAEINKYDFPNLKLQSLIIGGGTPTLLQSDQLQNLFTAVIGNQTERISDNFISCFETSPELATYKKLEKFYNSGMRRVSIGVQSFISSDLKLLGRQNTPEQSFKAFRNARKAGYKSINIDILGGFPGSNIKNWENNFEISLDLSPEFISVNMMAYSYLGGERYMAALERQGFDIPDFNQRVEMYEYAFEELENNGYEPVDFLVFAKKGTHSDNKVHGLGMTDNVIGFGPWVLSPIPGEVQVGFPFTNDYVERSVTKSHSFDYCENLFQLINGRLISNGKVSKKEIETLINCNFDQATARSRQISHLIEELYRLELIESTEDGFQFLKNKIPEGIIFLWNYQKEIKEMN